MFGKEVLNDTYSGTSKTINLEGLSQGWYYISVESEENRVVKKVNKI
jgi:hypothetical protein